MIASATFLVYIIYGYQLNARFVSLACVSSETHNLQRVSRPGGGIVPYIGYIGMCRAKGYVFLAVLV